MQSFRTNTGGSFLQKGGNSLFFNTSFWTIIGIIVIICLGFYIYYSIRNAKKTGVVTNNEFISKGEAMSSGQSKEAELMLFYVDWCPHCKTAKPEWEQLRDEYEGKTINGYSIIFTEINCTNESPDIENMMNTYKIEGYPTIKLLKDGTVIEYDAKPTKATLVQFLNTVL
jgi:thiol-disulfide isomerase/thioredoxin